MEHPTLDCFHLQMVIFLERHLISIEIGGKKHFIQWEKTSTNYEVDFLYILNCSEIYIKEANTYHESQNYMWQSGDNLGKQLPPRHQGAWALRHPCNKEGIVELNDKPSYMVPDAAKVVIASCPCTSTFDNWASSLFLSLAASFLISSTLVPDWN